MTEDDVEAALARIDARDPAVAREANHIYETLTWGEGPGMIDQAGVQDWLWYRLATKYLTDDPDHKRALAAAAAELFDELGLDRYAAICRSDTTATVHAAWDRSDSAGRTAMRKAMDRSGVLPPDTVNFAWRPVMGVEEAAAYSAVQRQLEAAIESGELVPGGRGWRQRQQDLTDGALDLEHPVQPGQTLRTAVLTERLSTWIREPERRSPELAEARAEVANRLLAPIEPPADLDVHLAPLLWLLEAVGDEQALTQAGYLNTAFVRRAHEEAPWDFPYRGAPRSETDDPVLHRLRALAEAIGALRTRGRKLRRTEAGTAMVDDPSRAWWAFVHDPVASPWERFVLESAAILLLEGISRADHVADWIASVAHEMGWRTEADGEAIPPPPHEVRWAVADMILERFGMLEQSGDWREREWTLTPVGVTTLTAFLRASAAGASR